MDKRQICNKALVTETSRETGESQAMVRSVMAHCFGFVAHQIKQETFQEVRLPFFGTFSPNYKLIQNKEEAKGRPRLHKPKNDTDEQTV